MAVTKPKILISDRKLDSGTFFPVFRMTFGSKKIVIYFQ